MLCGVFLLYRMLKHVCELMKLKFDPFFCWKNKNVSFTIFVIECQKYNFWGIFSDKIMECRKWRQGPIFLWVDENRWLNCLPLSSCSYSTVYCIFYLVESFLWNGLSFYRWTNVGLLLGACCISFDRFLIFPIESELHSITNYLKVVICPSGY